MTRPLSRFVAVGDSFTEGLDDLRADGTHRGWADRVADVLSLTEPDFRYANLAVRSLRIDAIADEQVPMAIALGADLITIAGGGNDILGVRVDVDQVNARLDHAVRLITASGAVAVVFAGFDPRAQLPPGRLVAGRTAFYNAHVAATARQYGAILIDLWAMPELVDPRMWSADRLHLSPAGHLHVAGTVLSRLDRPTPPGWPVQFEAAASKPSRLRRVAGDMSWSNRHLRPWVVRKIRGRSAGDGLTAKRPALEPWRSELTEPLGFVAPAVGRDIGRDSAGLGVVLQSRAEMVADQQAPS